MVEMDRQGTAQLPDPTSTWSRVTVTKWGLDLEVVQRFVGPSRPCRWRACINPWVNAAVSSKEEMELLLESREPPQAGHRAGNTVRLWK